MDGCEKGEEGWHHGEQGRLEVNPAEPDRVRKTAEGSVPGAREIDTVIYRYCSMRESRLGASKREEGEL